MVSPQLVVHLLVWKCHNICLVRSPMGICGAILESMLHCLMSVESHALNSRGMPQNHIIVIHFSFALYSSFANPNLNINFVQSQYSLILMHL